MKTKCKAVLFDLDGTLCDTAQDALCCMNLARGEIGLGAISYEELMVGINDAGISYIQKCLPEGTSEADVERVFRRYWEEYDLRCTEKTTVFPGMLELVMELKKRGIPRAVYTNKTHAQAVRVIEALFPQGAFDYVLGYGAFAAKPDPAGALWLIEMMGAVPEQTAYVGDSDTDMLTSANAGTFTVGVSWGYRPSEMLEKMGAKYVAKGNGMDILQLF